MIAAALLLAHAASTKAYCDIFVLKDCPIANQYTPEIKRLAGKYKNVQFRMVFEDEDIQPKEVFDHLNEYGLKLPGVLDDHHRQAKQYGATISPTAVVTVNSRIVYKGRIDDTYVSIGKRKSQAASHDLSAALDAVLAGKPVKTVTTQAVGCRLY